MNRSAFVLALAFITGCATTAKFEDNLKSRIGENADTFIQRNGAPTSETKLSDGRRVITYRRAQGQTSMAYSPGVVGSESNYCEASFTISLENKIESYSYRGNSCKLR